MPERAAGDDQHEAIGTPRSELVAFLTLAIVIWPAIAVAVVGGYGFLVWMVQLIYGPPGPPA